MPRIPPSRPPGPPASVGAGDGAVPATGDRAAPAPSLPAVPTAALPTPAERELDEVRRDATLAAAALPGEVGVALERALRRSAERVSSAYGTGRIDAAEVSRAAHMLDEMVDALLAIEEGRFVVSSSDGYPHSDLIAREVTTSDGDVLRIGVRPAVSAGGQARVKIESVQDDGEPVPKPSRVMVRFDLEDLTAPASGSMAVLDLQFGAEHPRDLQGARSLDMRVHGVMLVDGEPKLNRGGGPIADHHFRDGMPDDLGNAGAFASFARGFLDDLAIR